MKKIIFGLTLFIVPFIVIINIDKNSIYDPLPDATQDDTWERIKIQVYEFGKHKNRPIFKYNGPILFKLKWANKSDSLAFESVLNELREIIPSQEINYFSVYTGVDFEGKTSDTVSSKQERRLNSVIQKDTLINGYSLHYLKRYAIGLNFKADNVYESTKQILDFNGIITIDDSKTLGHFNYIGKSNLTRDISGYLDSSTHLNFGTGISIEERARIIKNVVFKILSANSFHISKDYYLNRIGSSDEKVMQKFYNPYFEDEFKDYIHNTYSWRYAINFLNKEKTKVLAIWVCMIVGLILALLGFAVFYKKRYKKEYFNYAVPMLAITLGVLNVFLIYELITNSEDIQTKGDVFGIHIFFITVALIVALFLMIFDKYIIKKEMNFTLQFVLKISYTFLVFVSPIAIVFIFENIHDIWSYNNWVVRLSPLILSALILTLGRGILLYLNHFSENLIKQKDLELSQLKEINAQAEVKLLQSQINPHFLYNALNSIASLAHKNADKTEKMALSLSDLFKYTINRKGKKDSTIVDEVEMVQNYLEVEQIRFGDRLNFTIDVDKSLENKKIPMFLIQPLIENAVKHGISKVEKNGQITLCIQKDNGGFIIIVEDNGPDFPDGLVSGYGLQTVFDLLRLTYKDKASISWKNTPTKHIKINIEN